MSHSLQNYPTALPSNPKTARQLFAGSRRRSRRRSRVRFRVRLFVLCALALAAGLAITAPAQAALVTYQAASAVVVSGGTAAGSSIVNSHNQSGLSSPYSSGNTSWAPYVTSTLHTSASADEWFALLTPIPFTSSSVTYDLGVLATVGALAVWNEDWGGASSVAISFGDFNGVFGSTVLTMSPTDNIFGTASYAADLVNITSPAGTRYVNLKLNCPQLTPGLSGQSIYTACSIGEVAFGLERSSITPLPGPGSPVPEPASLALAGLAITALGATRRQRGTHPTT